MKYQRLWAFLFVSLQAYEAKPKSTKEILSGKHAHIFGKQSMRFETQAASKKSLEHIKKIIMFAKEAEVRSTFEHLSLQAKTALIKEMNIMQYHWFLVCFSEKEWQEMHKRLAADQQKYIPSTRLEQLAAIRDVWMTCSRGFGMPVTYKTDPQVTDLARWREKALRVIVDVKYNSNKEVEKQKDIYFQWIERLLLARKLALLKEIAS